MELSGFQKHTRTGMTLQVNETATINVELGVGGVTENVTVSAESPLLETSNANRGTVIDSARIAEIPLQSRSPMALVPLVAGVNYNAQAIYLRPFDNGALAAWSMNGGQSSNNEFLLDGAPNNANQGGNNIAYVPPAAAVQEMKISTNSYDAQYGRTAGGVVNVSLKSGTNSFHGEVYDYMRRKALAANSFILNTTSRPKTDQYIDQYGFSVDGPIFKNKTFFLFTGEKYREGTPAPLTSTVPTPAMRNGDFSGVVDASGRQIVIYDPATGRADANGNWIRDPFPGNRIPADRINPTARRSCSTGRSPTARRPAWRRGRRTCCGPSTSTRTCSGTGSARSTTTSTPTTASSSDGARTSETRSATGVTPSAAVPARPASFRSGAPTARWSATGCTSSAPGACSTCAPATPTSWSGAIPTTRSVSTRRSSGPTSLVNQMPTQDIGGIFPRITGSDFATLSRGSSPNRNRNYSVQPNVSLTRGAHNIRGGLDMRWTNVFNENYNNSGGFLNFNRDFTESTLNSNNPLQGHAFASFLLGAPTNGNVDVNPKPHYQWFFVAPWIQDDWRVNNKLTLNLGFRWDVNGSVTEENDMLNYAFDPTIVNPVSARVGQQVMGGIRFAGVDGAPDRPWKLDKNNWQARVGMAYSLNDKTVLRAGYGKYFLNPTSQGNNAGFSSQHSA